MTKSTEAVETMRERGVNKDMGTTATEQTDSPSRLDGNEQGERRAKVAETIPSRVEYFEFNNQPREQWPTWLQAVFAALPETRAGLIATAYYETDSGEPEWWRWFEPQGFFSRFRQIS